MIVLLGVVIAFFNSMRSLKFVVARYQHGSGYSSTAWRRSEIVDYIFKLDSATLIYSNGADALNFLTGRPVQAFPKKFHPRTAKPMGSYLEELETMRRRLQNEKGVIVYFFEITWRWYLPTADELIEQIPLSLLKQSADGAVYEIAKSNPN